MPPQITVIGAGSASFGLNTLAALIGSEQLRGAELALVDRNPQALELVGGLAERLNSAWDAGMALSTHNHHAEALPGSDFVVLAIEVSPREALWRTDYEIPLKYGVRQPYAENGGPGGFAHAARNIPPVLDITHAMERFCPDAWLINYTNPMVRICDAVNRYSTIKVIGLCHQIFAGYAMVGRALSQDLGLAIPDGFTDTHASPLTALPRRLAAREAFRAVQIQAAGLNHFTWMLSLHDRKNGRDLYPLFRERWKALPADFEPLTRRVFDAFGFFPIPGDEHLCEYLPWTSDAATKPWEKYEISLYDWDFWANDRGSGYTRIADMTAGRVGLDELRGADSEGALEVITSIYSAGAHYHEAVNLPNRGQIANLPEGAIVETPGMITGAGVHPVVVGPLPEGIAELCRRELAVVRLAVDAAVSGDRQTALQCLLLDPVITDLDVAKQVLDEYLKHYRQHLPQFWGD